MKRYLQTESDAERILRLKRKEKRKYRNNLQKRLAFIYILMAAALLLLSAVLIIIVSKQGDEYTRTVYQQQNYSSTTVPFRRGSITDRNGTVLAASERRYIMILDPSVILADNARNEAVTLRALTDVYDYDEAELRQVIEKDPERAYIRYAFDMTEEEMQAFADYKAAYNALDVNDRDGLVTGVWFETSYKRVYPMNEFACTLLGFSGTDPSRGNWGIEEYYNDELSGTDGITYGYINENGTADRTVVDAEHGNTVVTTIDFTLQTIVETTIRNFVKDHDCANLGVIVMDPDTAEILALATDRSYDLNSPTKLSAYFTDEEIMDAVVFEGTESEEEKESMRAAALAEARANIWKDFAVADSYEPGSTAKPFTVAAALEEARTDESMTFECEGQKVFGTGGEPVVVKCNEVHENIDLAGSLAYSCNSAMMDLAGLVGYDYFTEYQTVFGFGRQTGVDLPGETAGLIYTVENMKVTDLATNSFGQNFNVNMVQMAAAFSSVINGGNYYQPHIVDRIVDNEGNTLNETEPVLVRRTVSRNTAEFIRSALRKTVTEGTGTKVAIEGYDIGGKTGTAQKHPRSEKKYVTSFIGFAPVDDPEVVVYVVIDDLTIPETEKVSTKYAIALAREIFEQALPYMGVECAVEVAAPLLPRAYTEGEIVPSEGILMGDNGLPLTDDDGEAVEEE